MRALLVLAGLTISLAAASQEIYRWVDRDGVVHYSDSPDSPDAKLIDVIEPNAYEAEDAARAAGAGGGSFEPEELPEIASYDSLSIVAPEPDQVFFGADAVVNVQAELEGTLGSGHSVVFILNGVHKPSSGLSTSYAGLARGSYSLRASILDSDGNAVITSPQVEFHVRQPSIHSPQSPQAPPQPPVATPRPTPRPAVPRN
jgi:hypothetical protein